MPAVIALCAMLEALVARPRRDEAGQAVAEYLGLAALGVAAIVAIGGAMRLLGLDIVTWIRQQLGI